MSTINVNRMVDSQGGVLAPISSVMRNRIINGAMTIDQRRAGASATITNTSGLTYTLDRWAAYGAAASKFSVQQDAGAVTPPTGFTDYLGITSLSSYAVGSGEQFVIGQVIEGFNTADLGLGTANAATVTLSFWVRSSLTGSFGGSLRNSALNRSYPFSYTISAANTWEQKSITIAGDTTGAWLTTNGAGILCYWSLGSGSTLSGTAGSWSGNNFVTATGATSVVGTNGATFYITGVQLEKGTQATSFEYRQYGQELALCQRYYQLAVGFGGTAYSGTDIGMPIQFKTEMRASPSLSATAAIQITYAGVADYTQSSANATTIAGRINTRGVLSSLTNFLGLTNGIYHAHNVNVNNAAIALNAEL